MNGLICCVFSMLVIGVFGDSGHMDSCGGSTFKLSWTPAALAPNENITISLTGTAGEDFSKGTVNITVAISGYTVFEKLVPATCDEAIPYAKGLLKCPVKKGASLDEPKMSVTVPESISNVPKGIYTVYVSIINTAGKLFLCAKGDIIVAT